MKHILDVLTNKLEVAPMSETDVWLIGTLTAFILIGLTIRLALFFRDFSRELILLNMEIRRTEGREQQHYMRRRRRLWLSLLPFVRY